MMKYNYKNIKIKNKIDKILQNYYKDIKLPLQLKKLLTIRKKR